MSLPQMLEMHMLSIGLAWLFSHRSDISSVVGSVTCAPSPHASVIRTVCGASGACGWLCNCFAGSTGLDPCLRCTR
eukprot:1888434-Alexandrium_andersonii.AAC.1